jgi:predicted peptidase
MKRRRSLVLIALLSATALGCSGHADAGELDMPADPGPLPQDGGFVLRSITSAGITYPYQVFLPRGYDRSRRWPVIFALHGGAERGSDGQKQMTVGLGPVVAAQRATFPAVVVFPQVPALGGEKVTDEFLAAAIPELDRAMAEFNGDPDRVYIAGNSLGGIFAYALAYQNPGRFAALVVAPGSTGGRVIAGNRTTPEAVVDSMFAQRLRNLPMWIFHGSADPTLPVARARAVVQALRVVGAPITYTEYAGVGHDVWDRAYATPELWTWLFAQRRAQ